VITWFQNRRAKQKRDIEEMKNDLTAAKGLKLVIDSPALADEGSNHFDEVDSDNEFDSEDEQEADSTNVSSSSSSQAN